MEDKPQIISAIKKTNVKFPALLITIPLSLVMSSIAVKLLIQRAESTTDIANFSKKSKESIINSVKELNLDEDTNQKIERIVTDSLKFEEKKGFFSQFFSSPNKETPKIETITTNNSDTSQPTNSGDSSRNEENKGKENRPDPGYTKNMTRKTFSAVVEDTIVFINWNKIDSNFFFFKRKS